MSAEQQQPPSPSARTNEIILLGVHREEDGTIVFTDPNAMEHRAKTADGVKRALDAIIDDDQVPRTEVPAADSAAAAGIVGIAAREFEEHATAQYGTLIGKLAGVAGARVAGAAVKFMQRNSRGSSRGPSRGGPAR